MPNFYSASSASGGLTNNLSNLQGLTLQQCISHEKKNSNFDLQTLNSENRIDISVMDDLDNPIDESNIIQDEEITKPQKSQLLQGMKIKEYLQRNQSLPFRLNNVYNTQCDVKKNLNFDFNNNNGHGTAHKLDTVFNNIIKP